ncbi:tetratricopeptide repeat protein [Asticcacaulis solisilvae]|uniref:tetratricopeptide repeat protein n=1 Tax=Asticcacaulis solisilvae TaxID=1217274 RepID=UPI003FD8EF20
MKSILLTAAALACLAASPAFAGTPGAYDGTGSQFDDRDPTMAKSTIVADDDHTIATLRKSLPSHQGIIYYDLATLLQQGAGSAGVDLKQAYDLYEQAANAGEDRAQAIMCVAYLLGEGRPYDLARSMSYCTKLPDGHPIKTFVGAYDFEHGLTGPADPETALANYVVAAKGGAPEAFDAVGSTTLKQPDKAAIARQWFRKAAMLGSADGMDHLAGMVMAGQGGPADEKEATWLYVNAARRGNAHAQAWLAAQPQPPAPLPRVVLLMGKTNTMITETVTDEKGTHTRPFDMSKTTRSGELFPMAALNSNASGSATLHCYIAADHHFDLCLLQREYPVGYNFGPVLLAIYNRPLTAAAEDKVGRPTANSVYLATVNWKLN